MNLFSRVVLGYHGCTTPEGVAFAQRLLMGEAKIGEWRPSANEYDWLGHGIYFWEHSPARARQWAGPEGSVIGAVIQLGRCFDLTDLEYTGLLKETFESLAKLYDEQELALPKNEGRDLKLRKLDCLVINQFMDMMDNEVIGGGEEQYRFQTIRCPFEEGYEAFPGSMLKTETHIQISVRDAACILGVFRPTF